MFCKKNHRRQCRRKFFSCDESRRLSSQKSGDIVLFQHAFWMSDFLMNVAHLHQKICEVLAGMLSCRVFFDGCWPPSSKKYAKCWQGCCHRPFFLMNAGHFHPKKVVIFKGRDFDVHMFVFLSRSIIFLMMIQLPDFTQRLSVGTWVSCFFYVPCFFLRCQAAVSKLCEIAAQICNSMIGQLPAGFGCETLQIHI